MDQLHRNGTEKYQSSSTSSKGQQVRGTPQAEELSGNIAVQSTASNASLTTTNLGMSHLSHQCPHFRDPPSGSRLLYSANGRVDTKDASHLIVSCRLSKPQRRPIRGNNEATMPS